MKRTHTSEQIIDILRQVERQTAQGKTVVVAGTISTDDFYTRMLVEPGC